VNRLRTAQTASTWGNSYLYDAWGDLLQKNVIRGTAESMALTFNNKNQVTTPAFNYDGAGNVTWDTVNAVSYDAESRMTPASGATYTYDGDGRRVQKSDGTLYWVDDSFEPLSVGTATGITQDYIFLNGQRIAFVPLSSGNPYYYLSDHLGSDTVLASGDGKTIQWEADYFPFGAQRAVLTNLTNNPYQFTGYEYDSGTGYNYAVARFEAGRWGRFLSPDPYLGSIDASNPQSLNRYSYVDNNPANFIDPLGLIGLCPPGMQTDAKGTGCEPKHGTLVDTTPGGGTGGPPAPAPGGPPDPKEPKKPKKPAEPKPGWCTATVHAGNTVGALAGAVAIWSVFADAGIVTAPVGISLGASALIGGGVAAIAIEIGDAGIGLGICQ
jgi:RHS repeat-associated protein